ncbi:arginyl-tRNA--protein transferase 1-like [Styela clava]
MDKFTIVEYYGYNENFHCGYCNGTSEKYSHGMWAHAMTCLDYQTLIDRGWRRSGVYCYKPDLEKSCCPQYTIRCRALDYKLTKSKKKVLNKMKQFLESEGDDEIVNWKAKNAARNAEPEMEESVDNKPSEIKASKVPMVLVDDSQLKNHQEASDETKKSIKAGLGADPSKPICRKAKVLRQQKKQKRDLATASGDASFTTTPSSQQSKSKTLQEYVPHLLNSTDFKRKLEVRMVHAKIGNSEFEATRKESYSLYKKYQQIIHGDDPSDCSEKQWIRFLVDCPLHRDKEGPGPGYGNYHQQYVLDGKIIAVGVVDVLPNCLSSVYLYYDPDYGFLSLGIYTALSEIAYTQTLYEESNDLEHYYMGFYIHSCQKMKYKGGYQPSDLLCPETYKWVPSELCFPQLDKEKYCRLNELNGGSATDVDQHSGREDFDMNEIGILHRRSLMRYGLYTSLKYNALVEAEQNHCDDMNEDLLESQKQAKNNELENLKGYVSAVGAVCAKRMFVYRS